MTQQEFENRTGIKVSADEFDRIHEIYMESPLDKDDWCAMWKKMDLTMRRELRYQTGCAIALQKELNERQKREMEELQERTKKEELERIEFGKFLADEAHKYSSTEAREKAIELMGFKLYIAYKMAKGYGLWEMDQKEIIDRL